MSDWDDDWKNPILDDNWESPLYNDNNSGGSKRGVLLGVAACVFFVGLIVVGIVAVTLNEDDDLAKQQQLSRTSVREAFDADDVGVGEQLQNELELFLDRLMEASNADNELALRRMFDEERYYQQVINCGIITAMTFLEKRNLKQHVADRGFPVGWGHYAIIHVDPLPNASEFVVYVHLKDEADTIRDNFRFWVSRSDRGWKLFDWEVIDFGMPESVEEALMFEYSLDHRTDEFIRCTEDIDEAYQLYDEGNYLGAADKIRQAEARDVHPKLKDDAELRIAYAWSHIGTFPQCLAASRRISSPDEVPGAYSMQVHVYDRWRHYEKAAEIAEKHEAVAGIDPFVVEARCRALDQLSRLEEAAPTLLKWLRWDPENIEAMQFLGRALPADQKDRLVEHLERVSNPLETAVSLAEHFTYNDEFELSQLLVTFVEQSDPGSPRVDYLHGLIERMDGNFEQAAELFLKAMRNEQDEELKDTYYWEYIDEMVGLNKMVEAYESLEDRNEAFQSLAEWIDLDEDNSLTARSSLRRLIEAHRQSSPDDPWLHYYTAVLLEAEQNYEEAIPEFEEAARSDDEDLQSMISYRRVGALLQAGRDREAYESSKKTDDTFRQIAGHYQWRKKPQELRNLVETHRSRFPENPWLNYYQGIAFMLEKKYEQAEQLFEREFRQSEDEYVQNSCRNMLLESKFESRGALKAYRDLDFSEEAFQRYANRLSQDEQWSELKTLIDLHERHHPEDANLLSWKVNELWRTKDYSAIVRNYSATRPVEETGSQPWQFEELEDQVLRSYLRLNRLAEAVSYAESRFEEDGDAERLLIAHLFAGNFDEAREVFKLYDHSAYTLSPIYTDEDVGEQLLGEECRTLREQFPPPVPYDPYSRFAVLFLDEPASLDSSRVRELFAPVSGEPVEIAPLEGEAGTTVILIKSEDESFMLTQGDSNYIPAQDSSDYARELQDPQLQSALRNHLAWVSLEIMTGHRYTPTEKEQSLGYQLISKLLDEHCLGLYFEHDERMFPASPEVKQALKLEAPETELKELGEEFWIYVEPQVDPAESLETRRCQARLHRFAKAFSSRTPEQEFSVQVEISANRVKELHWVRVENITRKRYGGYSLQGTFLTGSRILPHVIVGEPISVRKYEVFNWKYGTGEEMVRGRSNSSK